MDEINKTEGKQNTSQTSFVLLGVLLLILAGGALYFATGSARQQNARTDSDSLLPPPPAPNLCMAATTETATSYLLPHLYATEYKALAKDDIVMIAVQSADGWYGFDPLANEGNLGIFRLRWLAPDSPIALSPECDTIPRIPAIDVTACYVVAKQPLSIVSVAAANAGVVGTLAIDEYAKIMKTDTPTEGWVAVTFEKANTSISGFVAETDALGKEGVCND